MLFFDLDRDVFTREYLVSRLNQINYLPVQYFDEETGNKRIEFSLPKVKKENLVVTEANQVLRVVGKSDWGDFEYNFDLPETHSISKLKLEDGVLVVNLEKSEEKIKTLQVE